MRKDESMRPVAGLKNPQLLVDNVDNLNAARQLNSGSYYLSDVAIKAYIKKCSKSLVDTIKGLPNLNDKLERIIRYA